MCHAMLLLAIRTWHRQYAPEEHQGLFYQNFQACESHLFSIPSPHVVAPNFSWPLLLLLWCCLRKLPNHSLAIWATCSSLPGSSKRWVAPGTIVSLCSSISSSSSVSRSKSKVPTPASCNTLATYLFLGLCLPLPLPCANNTTPCVPSGISKSPESDTEDMEI